MAKRPPNPKPYTSGRGSGRTTAASRKRAQSRPFTSSLDTRSGTVYMYGGQDEYIYKVAKRGPGKRGGGANNRVR